MIIEIQDIKIGGTLESCLLVRVMDDGYDKHDRGSIFLTLDEAINAVRSLMVGHLRGEF